MRHDRGEVFGRRFHHSLSSAHASGEKDEIKRKLQEFTNYFSVTGNRSQSFWFEILRDQFQ
jgi:hypothetical protein